MKTKMNLNVVAENEEEKEIEKFLELLHSSNEVEKFLETMRQEAKKRSIYKYRERIKDSNSAIRTYRINNKKLEDVHDYVGISFITNNEKEIYPIIDYLKEKLSNAEYIDFVDEKYIYSPLVYIKWVPPLGYNVFAKEKLIPNAMEVPIEIRVCSKEGYISEQSAYYSVQKNDMTNLPREEKNQLRNIVQHITYKLALLNMRELTEKERKKHIKELNSIIQKNSLFLRENYDLCKDAILDFGRLTYRCKYDKEMTEDQGELTKEEIDKIDEFIKNKFSSLLENGGKDIVEKASIAVEEIQKIEYKRIKEELNIN